MKPRKITIEDVHKRPIHHRTVDGGSRRYVDFKCLRCGNKAEYDVDEAEGFEEPVDDLWYVDDQELGGNYCEPCGFEILEMYALSEVNRLECDSE